MPAEYVPRRRKKKHSILYGPTAFFLICIVIVLSMGVFFRVSSIEVAGESVYTDEEIMEAAGIEKGTNLFFINQSAAASRLLARMPYIETASIKPRLPGRVVIEIKASEALAYVSVESDRWLIDRNAKLLEKTDPATAEMYIQVIGLVPIAPAVGEKVAAGEAEATKVTFLAELLRGLETRDMIDEVADIELTSMANPMFRYQDRFTVRMGSGEDVEHKLSLLLSAVAQL
ncbi:MAG: FtsQ-type POTRA domain-containing protein, partial [Eubacteriales bacterium]|nr:FtsQ-type POTRA domain-containing protein [Eubacteriales bacterium]